MELRTLVVELNGGSPSTIKTYGPPSIVFGIVRLHVLVPQLLSTVNDIFLVNTISEVSNSVIDELVRAVKVKLCPPAFR